MFRRQPDQSLPADLVPDDSTAWAHALELQPTVGVSAAPATVVAEIRGQGLFVCVVVAESVPAPEREVLGELARAHVVRLLRQGTRGGGWAWEPAARRGTAPVTLPDDIGFQVPDHVPDEWTRAA